MRKNIIVTILFVIASGCGTSPGTTDSPDAGVSDCQTNPDANIPDAKPMPASPPCPFVCGGGNVNVAQDGSTTCASNGAACTAVSCSTVWTPADRLVCDPIRSQDGSTYVGRSNDCMVQRPDGTWSACYTSGTAWFCVETCTGNDVLSCPDPNSENCTCTEPSGTSFACLSSV